MLIRHANCKALLDQSRSASTQGLCLCQFLDLFLEECMSPSSHICCAVGSQISCQPKINYFGFCTGVLVNEPVVYWSCFCLQLYRVLWLYVACHDMTGLQDLGSLSRDWPIQWKKACITIAQSLTPAIIAGGGVQPGQVEAGLTRLLALWTCFQGHKDIINAPYLLPLLSRFLGQCLWLHCPLSSGNPLSFSWCDIRQFCPTKILTNLVSWWAKIARQETKLTLKRIAISLTHDDNIVSGSLVWPYEFLDGFDLNPGMRWMGV